MSEEIRITMVEPGEEPENSHKSNEKDSDTTDTEKESPSLESKQTNKTPKSENNQGIEDSLSPKNQEFYAGMSEKEKGFFGKFYEKIQKIPGADRVVGKLEIAFSEILMQRHDKKATTQKDELAQFDKKGKDYKQSREDIKAIMTDMKERGALNSNVEASLQSELDDIDKKSQKLGSKKESIQKSIDDRDDKISLYKSERDRIADKFIEHYKEKLRPSEKLIADLETERDHVNLLEAVAETEREDKVEKLNALINDRKSIESALINMGTKERKIHKNKAIKQMDALIASSRAEIEGAKNEFAKRKAEINKKIADIKSKSRKYRTKLTKFENIKNGDPRTVRESQQVDRKPFPEFMHPNSIDELPSGGSSAPERADSDTETTSADQDEKQPGSGKKKKKTTDKANNTSPETSSEAAEKGDNKFSVEACISTWNTLLENSYGEAAKSVMIDSNDFIKAINKSKEHKLKAEDFTRILPFYLKLRKKPVDNLGEATANFIEKMKSST
ncbi:MAG: hypothetical protein ABIE68_00630 [bacterium]